MPKPRDGQYYVSIKIEEGSELDCSLKRDQARTRMGKSQVITWYLSEYLDGRKREEGTSSSSTKQGGLPFAPVFTQDFDAFGDPD